VAARASRCHERSGGAKRPEQLADNLAATQLKLSADDLSKIDEVSRLPPEYPGWMLDRIGEYRRKQLETRSAVRP